MPRLRQVPKDDAHEAAQKIYKMLFGKRDPVASPGTATGTPGNWWTVFAGVPDCFDHAVAGFGFYLAQTRAGYARGSRFVFSQHCKASRDVGLSEEKIQAIPSWSVATCYSDLERAVLAYTDCLVLEGGRVPDGVFEALRVGLNDTEILELTYVTCLYELHATMSRALRLEYDDVDDPITEIPAPDGESMDVMAVVDDKS